jgi:hypothetical protein
MRIGKEIKNPSNLGKKVRISSTMIFLPLEEQDNDISVSSRAVYQGFDGRPGPAGLNGGVDGLLTGVERSPGVESMVVFRGVLGVWELTGS